MGKSNKQKSEAVTGLGLGLGMLTLADQVRKEMGVSDELFHRLTTEDGRQDWKKLFTGMQEDDGKKHVIDCDANPFVPEGWEVIEHRKGGEFQWDPTKVELYLCDEQKSEWIKGNELRKKLEGKPVLNACVLDYLHAHPELIPNEWKGKYIFFWGTIYRFQDGRLSVRSLGLCADRWSRLASWLGDRWYDYDPAVLCK